MKKYNVFVHVVTNCLLIAMLFGLYLFCVPQNKSVAASAPIYKGNTSSGKVAIMLNVYEGTEYVEKILDVLEKYDATCTFFVGGCWAEKNMDLLKRMRDVADIGNHGYLHRDHASLSKEQNREEILLCDRLIEKVTGKKTNLFAPPSGSMGEEMKEVCIELDYKVIMWTKDTIDWRDKDADLVYKRATTDIQSGDLVLMHPTAHTAEALPKIIEKYYDLGLYTATVTEIIRGMDNY